MQPAALVRPEQGVGMTQHAPDAQRGGIPPACRRFPRQCIHQPTGELPAEIRVVPSHGRREPMAQSMVKLPVATLDASQEAALDPLAQDSSRVSLVGHAEHGRNGLPWERFKGQPARRRQGPSRFGVHPAHASLEEPCQGPSAFGGMHEVQDSLPSPFADKRGGIVVTSRQQVPRPGDRQWMALEQAQQFISQRGRNRVGTRRIQDGRQQSLGIRTFQNVP